jgi:hypothetical protein
MLDETDCEPDRYRESQREMSWLIGKFPCAQRERIESYRARMREVFRFRHQLALVPPELFKPLSDAVLVRMSHGESIEKAIVSARASSGGMAIPGTATDQKRIEAIKAQRKAATVERRKVSL